MPTDKKLSDLVALAASPAIADYLHIIDDSEVLDVDKNKSITVPFLFDFLGDGLWTGNLVLDSGATLDMQVGTIYVNEAVDLTVTSTELNLMASATSVFKEIATNNLVGGTNAGSELSAGTDNVFGGTAAGRYGDGNNNVALGSQALEGTTGNDFERCVGIGYQAGLALTTGTDNILIGYQAGLALSAGTGNILMGSNAGAALAASGFYNVMIGEDAGLNNVTGQTNVIVGRNAGKGVAANSFNGATLIGYQAGLGITTAGNAVCVGQNSASLLTSGNNNIAIGVSAHNFNETGQQNVVIGSSAGYGVSGQNNDDNTFIGYRAGNAITTGTDNLCLGSEAGDNITSGLRNIAIGSNADPLSATGNDQFVLGGSTRFLVGDMANYQLAIYGANGYLNFNTTLGSGGYGVRDNAGVIEIKDSGGAWAAPGGGLFAEDGNRNIVGGANAGSELSAGVDCFYGGNAAGRYGDNDRSIGIGTQALEGTTGNDNADNIGIGYQAGLALTTGSFNILIGTSAGLVLTSGSTHTIIGYSAGTEIDTAQPSTYVGCFAGRYGNGSQNTAIGYQALQGVTANNYNNNTAVGYQAGSQVTTGGLNVIMGHRAGLIMTSGASNVIIGKDAGIDLTTGGQNVFIGYLAGGDQIGASQNVCIGYQAGRWNQTGTDNLFIGHNAGLGVSTNNHSDNTFLGHSAGLAITTGGQNTLVGKEAGLALTTGVECVAIGYQAMQSAAATVDNNTIVGVRAGQDGTTFRRNVFMGSDAYAEGDGNDNVAIGYQAMRGVAATTTAFGCTAVGRSALSAITTGSENVAIGGLSGDNITTGSYNIVIGRIDVASATADNQFNVGNTQQEYLRGDMANYQLAIWGANGYLNFNTTLGSTGYGVRDNSGVMEAKDSGGQWSPVAQKDLDLVLFASGASVTTGDGTEALSIPASFNGLNLIDAIATVHTQGVTGTTDIVVRRRRAGADADMLSTAITIAAEYFANDGVIDGANDDVATGDQIYIDVDAIHSGTAPLGLSVTLTFG